MHHFTGSTLEAKIQYIILLKHHFTGSFLKKIAWGAHHFTGASFYRGKLVKFQRSKSIILLGHHFTGYVLYTLRSIC